MDAPAVAVSADGKLIATAWMDTRRGNTERDVWWRIIRNGRPGPERPLADDPEGTQGHTALAVDGAETVHAVWESEGTIRYRSSKDEEVRTLAQGNATQPSLAAAGEVVVAAWETGGAAFVRRIR